METQKNSYRPHREAKEPQKQGIREGPGRTLGDLIESPKSPPKKEAKIRESPGRVSPRRTDGLRMEEEADGVYAYTLLACSWGGGFRV